MRFNHYDMKLTTTILATLAIVSTVSAMGHKGKHKKGEMMNVEFYMVGEDEMCDSVPSETMMGDPMMDGCHDMEADDMPCLCVKKPQEMLDMMRSNGMDMSALNEDTGFFKMCGSCKDPCALMFKPDMAPEMMMMMMGEDMMMNNGMMPPLPPPEQVPRTIQALMRVAMNIMKMQEGDHGSHSHEDGEMSASHMMDDY